jgi:hypothetical protein
MTKPETTPSEQTGTKPTEKEDIRTINFSANFKGPVTFDLAIAFYDWCDEVEKKFGVVCTMGNSNYNADWRTDRTRTSKDS